MAKLTAPNGATVEVDSARVERLVRYGFTEAKPPKSEPKTTAKKSASSKSSK